MKTLIFSPFERTGMLDEAVFYASLIEKVTEDFASKI
jgi:hypothetical protein